MQMAYDKIKDALKEPKKKPKPETNMHKEEEKTFIERIKK
jgi:hypothetical protein